MSEPITEPTDQQQNVRVYRTAGSEVLVFSDDLVILSVDGVAYYLVSVTEDRGTTMHFHVPGLDILVALLRKSKDADEYYLVGIDDLFPGLGDRAFERTEETTFEHEYHSPPDFVPLVAFLGQVTGWSDVFVLAILELNTRDWYVFMLEGDPYTVGASGVKQEVTNLASAGIAGVTFRLNGVTYELGGGPFSEPRYMRDNRPMEYHDVEQFHIVVTQPEAACDVTSVQLTPLAHAQRP